MDLILEELEENIKLITLAGELDMYNSSELKQFIHELVENGGGSFIVDCKNLSYIDSSGISTLICCYSAMQKRRYRIFFVNVAGPVRRVIELTKLEGFLPLADTVESVLDELRTERHFNSAGPEYGIVVDSQHDLFNKVGMLMTEFPSDFKRIRYFTNLITQRAPAEIRDINILEQQISEIIKNAVKHGNKSNPAKKVKVWFSFSKVHAHLIVQDEGPGFQEIEKWNDFFSRRKTCFENHDFDEMEKYLTYRSSISDDTDGGNAMFAAVEYWNRGVVFTEKRNCIAVRREFSAAS